MHNHLPSVPTFSPRKQNHRQPGGRKDHWGYEDTKRLPPTPSCHTRPPNLHHNVLETLISNLKGRFCLWKLQFLTHTGVQKEGPCTRGTCSPSLQHQPWACMGYRVSASHPGAAKWPNPAPSALLCSGTTPNPSPSATAARVGAKSWRYERSCSDNFVAFLSSVLTCIAVVILNYCFYYCNIHGSPQNIHTDNPVRPLLSLQK